MGAEKHYNYGLVILLVASIAALAVGIYFRLHADGVSHIIAIVITAIIISFSIGLYFIFRGALHDLFTRLFKSRKKVVSTKESITPSPEIAIQKPNSATTYEDIAMPQPSKSTLSDHERKVLSAAIDAVFEYTDRVLGNAIDENGMKILRTRLIALANMESIPKDTSQVVVDRDKLTYVDICHYGWNIWYKLKGARNRFYDQTQLVDWLQDSFEILGRYDKKTLRTKLRTTSNATYKIPLTEDIREE